MEKLRLEVTENQRRLHIGSFFTDLNESDYQELVKIFSPKSDAVEFAEWISSHRFKWNGLMWTSETDSGYNKTTAELYKTFTEHKTK